MSLAPLIGGASVVRGVCRVRWRTGRKGVAAVMVGLGTPAAFSMAGFPN